MFKLVKKDEKSIPKSYVCMSTLYFMFPNASADSHRHQIAAGRGQDIPKKFFVPIFARIFLILSPVDI